MLYLKEGSSLQPLRQGKFDSTDSAVQRDEDWSTSPSTQYYQKLGGKLKQDSTGERLGSDWGEIGGRI